MMYKAERTWIIRNPIAGHRSQARSAKVLELLASKGVHFELFDTLYGGHAECIAFKACEGKIDFLIVLGGDGTLNEVINGLATFRESRGGFISKLAIFPSGTVNLIAKELNITDDPVSFVNIFFRRSYCNIWPAKLNDRYFISMVGVGFDAYIVSKVTQLMKQRFSKLAYVFQIGSLLRRTWCSTYEVDIDGNRCSAASLIITNSRYYAGGFRITPCVSVTAPHIFVCLFQRSSRKDLLKYLLYFLCNKLHKCRGVKIIACEKITVRGEPSQNVQSDGDMSINIPIRVCKGNIPITIIK